MKLYELTEAFGAVLDAAENAGDEDGAKLFEATLEHLRGSIVDKLDGCARVVRSLEAQAKACKEEKARFARRQSTAEASAKRLKSYMQNNMEEIGETKIQTSLFAIRIQNNPVALDVQDEKKIPDLWFISQAPKLDKVSALAAIKAGQVIDGLGTRQGKSLRIV